MAMNDGIRAAFLIVRLTFRADPWRAAWLVLRSPVAMCSLLGTAVGVEQLTNAVVAKDWPAAGGAVAILVAMQVLAALASAGSLSLRAMVIEKSTLLIDRLLMEAALAVPGLAHYETPEHRDQLELLRINRGELGEVIDSVSHNLGILLLTLGSVGLLARVNPYLALLPLAGLPSLWAVPQGMRWSVRAQEQSIEKVRAADHLFQVATSAAAGKEVRLFSLGETLLTRHQALWEQADDEQNRAVWRGFWLAAGGWQFFSLAYVAAIALVALQAVDGHASAGQVLMTVQLAAGINRFVMGIVFMTGWLFSQIKTAGRVVWLMDYATSSRAAPAEPADVPRTLRKGITLEHVTFRYPDTDADVLSDVSVHIPAGSTVAVVGENGAGKSTLIKLLARFYEPTEGRITVEDIDLRCFEPAQWRSRWGAGFQDFVRFELLAGETVGVGDLARIAEEAAIESALTRAAARDVVASLPSGTSTPLGRSFDDGAELSGGQWQKLALGRAMMREGPLVLVLDEPTASLDATTEHELFTRYAERAGRVARETGAITVLVSHRFSTVRMADLVLVIESGRLIEVGSHEALTRQGGLYAELYGLQARAYR
jgi:ATP-binding cassette subfamily B protein